MTRHQNLQLPELPMPEYLAGIQPPVSMEEALAYAAAHGAPPDVLRFMESLPAAVFTSAEGMRSALASVRPGHVPQTHPEAVRVGEDGTSS